MHINTLWRYIVKQQRRREMRRKAAGQPTPRLWTANFFFIWLVNLLVCTGGTMLITAFPLYVVSLGGSEVTVGVAAAIFAISCLLMRPIAGWLLDKRSRRVITFVGVAGTALIPPLHLVLPFLGWALLLRALYGLLWSAANTAATTNACDILPDDRFGEGMGYFGLTYSLSMVIGPALGLVVWQRFGAAPLYLGLSLSSLLSLAMLTRFRFAPVLPVNRSRSLGRIPLRERLSSLYDRRALPAAILMFAICLPGGAVEAFIALYTESTGLANGGIFFTWQAIGASVTRVFAGRANDKYGEGPAIYLGCACFVAGLIAVILSRQALLVYLGALFYGIGYGVTMPALQTLSVRIVPPERRGAASSTYLGFMDVSFGLGGLIGGLLVGGLGYGGMFGAVGFSLVAALAIYFFWVRKTPCAFKVWQAARTQQAAAAGQ